MISWWAADDTVRVPGWGIVDTDDFAAYGQWAGGIGSLAAVVALAIVTFIDIRRRNAEARDARAAQARTVIAMVETSPTDPEEVDVVIYNHGPAPVLNVRLEAVEVVVDGERHSDWGFSPSLNIKDIRFFAPVIAPGESARLRELTFVEYDDVVGLPLRTLPLTLTLDLPYTITFTFIDAQGIRWRRAGSVLRRILGQG
ncbi:hypothetical protein [Saccharothrix texasensis]|uniref:Uncharacterized protein n=1 Tax=Saccharothrix texasensis TaxID=103734 RepID=A0A3N1H4K7_9PSEU|nr:hypothetical protein [Saccharothrix texasensis]ROP37445.1 hypothetical protein EDD40_2758 [Saccharothrix texasensis]